MYDVSNSYICTSMTIITLVLLYIIIVIDYYIIHEECLNLVIPCPNKGCQNMLKRRDRGSWQIKCLIILKVDKNKDSNQPWYNPEF